MSATSNRHSNAQQPTLYVAFELSWTEWKLAFTIHPAHKPRIKKIAARDLDALLVQIAKSKKRFGLAADAANGHCRGEPLDVRLADVRVRHDRAHDRARRDCVHGDAVRAELLGQRAGQADDSAFRRRIGCHFARAGLRAGG